MKKILPILILLVLGAGLILLKGSMFSVGETEQVIVTEFGRPVRTIATAGLHFKKPFVQDVNRLEKRVMEWDGEPNQVPTKDKLFIFVDSYARWRIKDPLLFYQRLHDERSAQSRLDDILDGEARNAIARHELIEIVRTSIDRTPSTEGTPAATGDIAINWQPIKIGRARIAREVFLAGKEKLAALGIELLDIRFKRINYNGDVQQKIYDRMISERQQIADKFRSEGKGEAARIIGEKERELKRIESEAYKQIQEIMGKADAEASRTYAQAYNQSPAAYEFYQFMKTMDTYRTTLDKSTALVLSTSGDFYKYLQGFGLSGSLQPLGAAAQGSTTATAPTAASTPELPAPAPAQP